MPLGILPLEKLFYDRCDLVMYTFYNNMLPYLICFLNAKTDTIHNHDTMSEDIQQISVLKSGMMSLAIFTCSIDFNVPILNFNSSYNYIYYIIR